MLKLKNFILMIKIHVSTGSEIYYSLEHMKMNLTMLFSVYVGSICRRTCFEVGLNSLQIPYTNQLVH